MIDPSQIRAARGLIAISQTELASRAGLGLATVKRIEGTTGELRVTIQTLLRIRQALEEVGIVFLDQNDEQGPGVRLKKPLP